MVLDIPTALKSIQEPLVDNGYDADKIQFTIFGSPVPVISVPEKEVPFGGQVYHTPSFSRPKYSPIDIKFLVDNGYQNYFTLFNWLNLFNDYKNSSSDANKINPIGTNDVIATNPMTNYVSTFSLFGLDEFNNPIISFKYTGAFITKLSPIDFTYQEGKEIVCTATFVFNQLHVELLKNVNVSSC